MKSSAPFSHIVRLAFAISLGASLTSAQTYHVTDLGTLPGQQLSRPAAINNVGQVTGSTESFAFLYSNGTMQNLGTLPGGNVSSGYAINISGDVAGSSQFTNGGSIQHATLFRNGTASDLGFLAAYGNYSYGLGINSARQVVGYSAPSAGSSSTRAFIWDSANGIRDLGVLTATSINDSGRFTGTLRVPGTFSARHAYLADLTNGATDIGTIAGDFSNGAFINANGHVVGTSSINFDNRNHAFLYDGVVHDLGAIGNNDFLSDRSSGLGVNIHDEVVGSTYLPYTGGALYQTAFVYRNGTMS